MEIAASSADHDLCKKRTVYCCNGVQEYLVWEVSERRLHWFRLHEGTYVPMLPDEQGMLRSHVFPGLWLPVEPFLNDDRTTVMTEVQRGLATPEHAAFVVRLRGG